MNNEAKNEFDQTVAVEIEETELKTLAAAMLVRSGLQAGSSRTIQPCI